MDRVSNDWLRRLDAHLERGNELFEQCGRALDRNTAAFDRNTAAFERHEEAFDRNTAAFERHEAAFERHEEAFKDWKSDQEDLREFMRELTLRGERSAREQIRELRRHTDEVVAELRAQRGALFTILDRLSPGDSGSTA
jgi:uncharacterized protein YukE